MKEKETSKQANINCSDGNYDNALLPSIIFLCTFFAIAICSFIISVSSLDFIYVISVAHVIKHSPKARFLYWNIPLSEYAVVCLVIL